MKKRYLPTCLLIAFAAVSQAQTILTPNYTRVLHNNFAGSISSIDLLSQRATVYSVKSNYSEKHYVSTFDTTSGAQLSQVVDAIFYQGNMSPVREMPSQNRFTLASQFPSGLDETGSSRVLELTRTGQVLRYDMSDRAQIHFWDVAESGRRRWIVCGGETLASDDPDSGYPHLYVHSNDGTDWHFRPAGVDPFTFSQPFVAGAIDNQGNAWTFFVGQPTDTDPLAPWLLRFNSSGEMTLKLQLPSGQKVRLIENVKSITPGTNRQDALIFSQTTVQRADLETGLSAPIPFDYEIRGFRELSTGQYLMFLQTPGFAPQWYIVNPDFTIASTYSAGILAIDRLGRVVRGIDAVLANESRFQIETSTGPEVFSVPDVGTLAAMDFDRYQNLVLTTYNAQGRMRLVGVSNLQDLTGPTAPVAPGANVQFRINLNFNAPPSGLRVLLYAQPGLTLPTEAIVPPGANSFTFDGNVTATDARTIRVRAKAAGKSVYSSVTVQP